MYHYTISNYYINASFVCTRLVRNWNCIFLCYYTSINMPVAPRHLTGNSFSTYHLLKCWQFLRKTFSTHTFWYRSNVWHLQQEKSKWLKINWYFKKKNVFMPNSQSKLVKFPWIRWRLASGLTFLPVHASLCVCLNKDILINDERIPTSHKWREEINVMMPRSIQTNGKYKDEHGRADKEIEEAVLTVNLSVHSNLVANSSLRHLHCGECLGGAR